MKIVLASGSPRRRELLDQIGAKYEVRPSKAEETITGTIPEEIVKELALRKGREVANHYKEEVVVLSADTVVASEGKILGKPKDDEEAKEMIGKLQGKSHEVYTGVAIIIKSQKSGELSKDLLENKQVETEKQNDFRQNQMSMKEQMFAREQVFAVETKVKVAVMSKEEIEQYIRTGEHKDKAGAYAIQGKFAPYIEGIEGDYYNVVGFPISKICQELKKEGITLVRY